MTSPATNLAPALEAILGASRVLSDFVARSNYAIDEIIPSVVVKPYSPEEVAEIVRFAALEKLSLIPTGARTKLRIGLPPSRYDIAIDMAALSEIAHYDPGDLTLSVDAGAPIAKLNATLLEHHQFLPLLVPWYSLSTIGGIIASGIDSPLRQFYGTARDFLIGAEFVDGTGKLCKSGGRVVKNVTGYDLHKLLIGSLGTLAIITRLNFRTFPAPIAGSRGFVASFSTAEGALALRRCLAQSPLTPLTFDIVSPGLAQIFSERIPPTPEAALFSGEDRKAKRYSLPPMGDWFHSLEWQLCAAFAGTPEVLDRYSRDLTRLAAESHSSSATILDDTTRPALWGRLRESISMLLESSPVTAIFKISVLPSHHAELFARLQQIAEQVGLRHALVARAGGTIYFALLPTSTNEQSMPLLGEAVTKSIQIVSGAGGDAVLLLAPPALRARVNSRITSRPDLHLMRRLKSAFDPQNIFAPGRFI
jgi:glycolate oxidase FAD binding subunit